MIVTIVLYYWLYNRTVITIINYDQATGLLDPQAFNQSSCALITNNTTDASIVNSLFNSIDHFCLLQIIEDFEFYGIVPLSHHSTATNS
jgi:hypothetical protein